MASKKNKTEGRPPYRPPQTAERFKGQVRVENVKPYTVFQFDINGSSEIHIAMPNQFNYGNALSTICVSRNGEDCCDIATLQCFVEWEYEITILKGTSAEIEVRDGKFSYKLAKMAVEAA